MANVNGFASIYQAPQIGPVTASGFRTQLGSVVYGMRGWDPGASVYRSWIVVGTPDYTTAAYTGAGAGTLTGVVVAWRATVMT